MRGFLRDSRGAVTAISAVSMTACLGCLAFAVDMGSVYFESRRLQGSADAAALSAAADLPDAQAAADAAVAANRWGRAVDARVETGRYRADPAIPAHARFTAQTTDRDAARVTLETDARLFFGIAALGRDSVRISRTATAARANLASFTIGSRLLALEGGIANALLGALTGSQVKLSVMDYNALVGADIDLLAFSDALRTELDLQAASFDEALAAEITTGRAINVIARALDANGSASSATAIRQLAAGASTTTPIRLDRLIDLGPIGAQDRVSGSQSIRVNALDLARSVLELSNGKRQVQLDLGATVPGLVKTTITLAIGDRPADSPWLTVTHRGEPVIRTAQTRLYIDAQVAPAGALLGIASVRLPLFVELAEAEAKLDDISCAANRASATVSLLVRPAIGHAAITDIFPADISDHRQPLVEGPARIVSAPLVAVSGQARVDLTGPGWQEVDFSSADIAARTVKTVSSNSLVQGVVLSLVKKLNLTVNVAGLGLGTSAVSGLVGVTLAPAAPALDGVVNSLTALLGIHLGQADVRVNGVRCGVPALVA